MWRSVDDALVFAGGGRVAYYGAAADAAALFEAACPFAPRCDDDSPPDYVLECVSHPAWDEGLRVGSDGSDGSDDGKAWTASPDATADAVAAASRRAATPSPWEQFLLHVPRACLSLTRAPSEFVFEVCVQFAAGAFLGALYPHFEFGDCQQVAFILQLSLGGTIMLSSARTFGSGRAALWRELSHNCGGMALDARALCGATCLVEVPRLALLTLAFLCTWFPTASPRCAFGRYFAPCFTAALAASGAAHVVTIAQDMAGKG